MYKKNDNNSLETINSVDDFNKSNSLEATNPIETEKQLLFNIVANKVNIKDGTYVILRTSSGYFLSIDDNGNYYANKSTIDEADVLKISITNDNYTGFFNLKNNFYASAILDINPYFLCSKTDYIQSWECFTLFKDNDYITISSQGREKDNDLGSYVTCEETELNRPIYVRAEKAQAWEDFSLFVYLPQQKIWANIFTDETFVDNFFN